MENQPQRPLPNGTAVLVLGIISIVGCLCYGIPGIVLGIIAIVLSNKDLRLYNADPTLYTQGSLSNLKSGRICGIIGLSISSAYLAFLIIYIFTVGWAFLSHPWMWNHSTTM
jgi:hypothetical protein